MSSPHEQLVVSRSSGTYAHVVSAAPTLVRPKALVPFNPLTSTMAVYHFPSDFCNSDDGEAEFIDPQDNNLPIMKPILDIQIPLKLPQFMLQQSPNSPATPTPGNLPTPTPIVVEPTPKSSAGFSVPTPRFIPKMKKFSGLSAAPASPALASSAIDVKGFPISPKTTRINSFEIGVQDQHLH